MATRSARKAAPKRSAAARTTSASASEPTRRPWSTWTAVTSQPTATASTSSASESAPPDTAHVRGDPDAGNVQQSSNSPTVLWPINRRPSGFWATERGGAVKRWSDGDGIVDAGDPAGGVADLLFGGQQRGALPRPGQQGRAALGLDRGDELLAVLVLADLRLDADQLL